MSCCSHWPAPGRALSEVGITERPVPPSSTPVALVGRQLVDAASREPYGGRKELSRGDAEAYSRENFSLRERLIDDELGRTGQPGRGDSGVIAELDLSAVDERTRVGACWVQDG